ncbi:MAG: tetratricopeptide repeat protein [Candidatus Thermoplasmatota archaeon]|jgi:tetratricopeptide (TPR) repeat protein|nr:tetratricopeptide repeat protein [Candidatus Thermoplasmatota archaeon]
MSDNEVLDGFHALGQKDLKSAHDHFTAILGAPSSEKDRYSAKIGLALTFRELGDIDKAIEEMKDAVSSYKNPIEAVYDLAMLYEEKEQYALAVQNFDLALSLDPLLLDAYNNRGIAWLKLPDPDQSIRDFRNALNGQIGSSRVLCNLGMAFLSDKRFEKAIDHFDRSLLSDETNIRSLCGKGLALYYLDRYDDSMICFDASISLQPDFYIAYYYKGVILKKLDLLDEAKQSLNEALKVRNNFPLAWFELGEVQNLKGDTNEALAAYTRAVELHPGTYEEALFNKGKLLFAKGRMKEALDCYRSILTKNGYIPSVWLEMGKTLLQMEGMEGKVLPVLKNALSLDPFRKESALILSCEYSRKKEFQKAYDVLKKVMDSHPDPEIGGKLAEVLYSMNRFKDCIDISEMALSLDPERTIILLPMGRAYGKLGKTEEYMQCLRRFLHKFPSDRAVETEMRAIK